MNARCYYYIKYKRFDNGRWESAISLITGKRIKFTDRQSAREYMKFLYDRGFDVELHRDDMKTWIEKMERGVDCDSNVCYN